MDIKGVIAPVHNYKSEAAIMEHRLDHARKKCDSYNSTSYWKSIKLTGSMLSYDEENLHYCITPKVACTFWKGILRYIAHDDPNVSHISEPADIDRFFMSFHQDKTVIKEWQLADTSRRRQLAINPHSFEHHFKFELGSGLGDRDLTCKNKTKPVQNRKTYFSSKTFEKKVVQNKSSRTSISNNVFKHVLQHFFDFSSK